MAALSPHQPGPLAPELMDRLSAMQIVSSVARASRGVGEKPSRASGPGMEFAEYRAYRPGDDLRHVDARSLALGAPLTRNFVQRQQLLVVLVVDLSTSMLTTPDSKAAFAISTASALGYAALAGQDRVQLALITPSGDVQYSPVWQGRSRAPDLFDFLSSVRLATSTSDEVTLREETNGFADAIRAIRPVCNGGTVVIALSDFWESQAPAALTQLASSSAAIVCLRVLSALERDPTAYGEGVQRLIDAETGSEHDITIDANMVRQYRQAFETHEAMLKSALPSPHIFLSVPAEQSLSSLCFETLPAAGVIA